MISTRRRFLGSLAAALGMASLPLPDRWTPAAQAASAPSRAPELGAGARQASSGNWTPLGPAAPVTRLFGPASGALFAATPADLLRSDDAGDSWRPVSLPANRRPGAVVEVDPADHRVIYADTDDGLQRSDDEAATWTPLLPPNRKTLRLAISPADPRVLYVAQTGASPGDFWFLRSIDWGQSWEQLDEQHQGPCSWSVLVLAPHASDPSRLFRAAGCYDGRGVGDQLDQSRDGGASWSKVLAAQTAFPRAIVGGSAVEPTRFFAAVNNDGRSGGSLVFRSDDDAATWTPILEHKGGGTMAGARAPSTTVTGLVYDSAMPAHAYVALQRKVVPAQALEAAWVTATTDGGAGWTTLGEESPDEIRDLLLGIDGRYLFAATASGVKRLALG